MSIKVTWYGHACFGIQVDGYKLVIDPFLTGNPQATVKPEEIEADYIIVTHGHGDHYGDTTEIAKRTGATVISNFEISNYAAQQGCEKTHPMHIGGGYNFPFGRLKLTIAHHGSSLPDGSYGGNPAGVLLTFGDKKIYHAGDTGLFYDMKLIGDEGITLAILPIGDNFTMGPDDALRAVELLRPKYVWPIHYDTFDVIKQDAKKWTEEVQKRELSHPLYLKPGESFEL